MSHRDGDFRPKRRAEGRYDPQRKARMPANGVAMPPITRNVQVTMAVVPDPMEAGAELYVSVNRRVDVLEQERSHKRISEGAYRTGREIQRTFESASRVGSGSQWREGDRVDMSLAKEIAIHRNVDIARAIDGQMRRLTWEVGIVGAAFLREILANGTTFADYAARTTAGKRRDIDRVADRFRSLLEDVVECRAARGRAS